MTFAPVSHWDPPLPAWFLPASTGVEVGVPDGTVLAPLELRFASPDRSSSDAPYVAHLDDFGRWEVEPAGYADGHIVALADTFSLRVPGWVSKVVDVVGNAADSVVDWAVGRTDPPGNCTVDGSPYPWASSSGKVATGVVHTCLRSNPTSDGRERIEVVLKSNRDIYLTVRLPDQPHDYVWVESSPEVVRRALGGFLNLVGFSSYGDVDHVVVLPPGATMTVGYVRPVGAAADLLFDIGVDVPSAVLTGLRAALGGWDVTALAMLGAECARLGYETAMQTVRSDRLDLLTFLTDCAATGGLSALEGLGRSGVTSATNTGRFLIAQGLASEGDLIELSKKIVSSRGLATVSAVLQRVLAARSVFNSARDITASVASRSTELANAYTVTLVPIAAPRPLSLDEVRSAEIPALCGYPAGRLVGGDLPGTDPGYVSLGEMSALGDVDGDGVDEMAVNVLCSQGGVAWPELLLLFRDDRSVAGVVDLGHAIADFEVWRAHFESVDFQDGRFIATAFLESSSNDLSQRTQERTLSVGMEAGSVVVSVSPPPASRAQPTFAQVEELLLQFLNTGDGGPYTDLFRTRLSTSVLSLTGHPVTPFHVVGEPSSQAGVESISIAGPSGDGTGPVSITVIGVIIDADGVDIELQNEILD